MNTNSTESLAQQPAAPFWQLLLRGAAIVVCFVMAVSALHPTVRQSLRAELLRDERTVVSTAFGPIIADGGQYTVAKIKTRDRLFLEVYRDDDDGSQKLLEQIPLSDVKDGYFKFNGHATNLAIGDIDGDGQAEILVPSFDQNLIGHLSIYRHQPGGFQKVSR